jgi:hypothetical protein
MSCSSPWSNTEPWSRRRWLASGMALAAASSTALPTWATDSRPPLTLRGTPLLPRGEGQMRFFGLNIYTARLWAADGFDPAQHAAHPLALELTYARTFSARDIAERSLQEMKRQTPINKAREVDWTNKLAAVLPDVKPGDSLLGFHRPDQGAMFQSGGRTLGTVDDPVFSALFFGIWLSPATSEPALRTALIAQR